MKKKKKLVHGFVIFTFVALYLIVSIISTIHVISFFELSNPYWLAISLAVAFEIGAAASLAALIVLNRVDMRIVWILFLLLTAMQMMGNTYYAFTNVKDYTSWVELFGLTEQDPIFQKRILSIISGAILPVIALGFIKSLVDYMKPDIKKREEEEEIQPESKHIVEAKVEPEPIVEAKVEPEPIVESKVEPEPIVESKVEPEPIVESKLEPEPIVESESKTEDGVLSPFEIELRRIEELKRIDELKKEESGINDLVNRKRIVVENKNQHRPL